MSLYFSPSEIDVARLEMVARELARERDKVIVRPGAGGFIWVGRQPDRFGPAFDEKTGVRALSSGHSSWSASQWATAKQLPYDGGLANRIILERYLSGGIETVAPYNGSTALVIHDPRSAQTHVSATIPASFTMRQMHRDSSSQLFPMLCWPIRR